MKSALCVLMTLSYLLIGCKGHETKPVKAPEPERKLVEEALPLPEEAAPDASSALETGLKPSLLDPVGGFVLPEIARLVKVSDEQPEYEVEAALDAVRKFYVFRGLKAEGFGGGRKGFVIRNEQARLHVRPGKGRMTTLQFFLGAEERPAEVDEASLKKQMNPATRREHWKDQSEAVRKAMESGNRNIGELLGEDFPD